MFFLYVFLAIIMIIIGIKIGENTKGVKKFLLHCCISIFLFTIGIIMFAIKYPDTYFSAFNTSIPIEKLPPIICNSNNNNYLNMTICLVMVGMLGMVYVGINIIFNRYDDE